MEEYYADRLNRLLRDKIINQYYSHDLINRKIIGSGGSASVYVTNWKNTSTIYAIKKYVDNKEAFLTIRANSHENIIQFRGVTKLKGEKKYSLVLEYADGGTLKDYLRNSVIEWKNQLRLAREIASAVLWLHDEKGIIHGDLHPKNVLIHKGTIKLADFGCSYLKESDDNTRAHGVTPYMDPKFFENPSYRITEKSDIYSLGVLFWELTSRKSPYKYKTGDDCALRFHILHGLREEPIHNTNVLFVRLYQKCWEHEPDNRPKIHQVISELNSINLENNNVSTPEESEESEESGKTEDLCLSDSD
ncbi:uncharacterized protein OCT59_012865 [Rhizophagus irregularis]|uniref:uncharacterized protein n=1 Tax=Rhizophagus irregularis TaxID=588596 RepID=UPI000CC99530|nr:hypothetical protein OCT59_012865 [Rhizophagus irregularis]GBC31985.1 kinase-like domain-containing protein [Rhizophagus irregularis DAOM 181602=DAOM 197198]